MSRARARGWQAHNTSGGSSGPAAERVARAAVVAVRVEVEATEEEAADGGTSFRMAIGFLAAEEGMAVAARPMRAAVAVEQALEAQAAASTARPLPRVQQVS